MGMVALVCGHDDIDHETRVMHLGSPPLPLGWEPNPTSPQGTHGSDLRTQAPGRDRDPQEAKTDEVCGRGVRPHCRIGSEEHPRVNYGSWASASTGGGVRAAAQITSAKASSLTVRPRV